MRVSVRVRVRGRGRGRVRVSVKVCFKVWVKVLPLFSASAASSLPFGGEISFVSVRLGQGLG